MEEVRWGGKISCAQVHTGFNMIDLGESKQKEFHKITVKVGHPIMIQETKEGPEIVSGGPVREIIDHGDGNFRAKTLSATYLIEIH